MPSPAASRTALGVLALRAVHQLVDGEPKVLDDPIAPRLVDEAARRWMDANAAAFATPASRGLRAHVVARSRYAEDRLAEARVDQYVLLGAGFDSFAHRQPAWARGLRIFEVDHPASQAAKAERLAAAGVTDPPNLTYAPIDFERTSLREGLARAGLAFDRPSFFSCLGVLVYLTAGAVDDVFRFVAGLPRASQIVFTLSGRYDAIPGGHPLAAAAAAAGEPWRSTLTAEEAGPKLRALGFAEVGVASAEEIARRYFAGRTDGLAAPRHARMAWARV